LVDAWVARKASQTDFLRVVLMGVGSVALLVAEKAVQLVCFADVLKVVQLDALKVVP